MQENNNQAEPTKAVSNGRNRRRCSNKVSNAAPQAPVCGLIEDASIFTEKLSGQHNKVYINKEEEPKATETESTSELIENATEQKSEITEKAKSCKCSKKAKEDSAVKKQEQCDIAKSDEQSEHSGPSFEETKTTQKRTLEVSLKKVPHKSEKVIEKDTVSYAKVSASMNKNAPKKGIISKIRAFFSKLMAKKSKKNSKNFKNNRGGYKKNYSKGQKRNSFDKNGNFDKTKDNNFRPNNRRKNYNRRPNSYNKSKTQANSATKE